MGKIAVTLAERTYTVEVDDLAINAGKLTAVVNGEKVEVTLPNTSIEPTELGWMMVAGRPYEIQMDHDLTWIAAYNGLHHLAIHSLDAPVARPRSGDGRVKAPIPGIVARFLVAVGDTVNIGQPVAVLEAMKMENEIRAPLSGKVTNLPVAAGQTVIRGQVLVEIE